MFIIIKNSPGMVPMSALAITEDEADTVAKGFVSDVEHHEGGPADEAKKGRDITRRNSYWESGSFVVIHSHELRI